MVLSFVLASISPACEFISGKTFAEICGADGTIKSAAIPDDLLTYLPKGSQQEKEQHHVSNDCSFCFAQTHLDQLQVASAAFLSLKLEKTQAAHYKIATLRIDKSLYQPRAPPSFLA